MKLNKWLFGAAALAMMASCSDNFDGPNPDNGTGGNQSASGVSYLGVSLELPSEAGTRAQENDQFDDGLAIEYEVHHAAILLFRGNEEATSKFIGAYELGTDQAFDQPNGDQITVSFQKTIKVLEKPMLDTGEKLWGLAIVNYSKDIFDINKNSETDSEGYGSLKVTTKDETVKLVRFADNATDATTFSTFRGYITDSKFIRSEGGYFFMTNAPLSNRAGTSSSPSGLTVQTLSELKPNFEKSENEAEQNPAGCIFVERALAKITLNSFPGEVKLPYTKVILTESGTPEYTTTNYTLTVSKVEWLLDNEEPTSYIVRNAQTTNSFWNYAYNGKYRFVGNMSMENPDLWPDVNGEHKAYRTYWCVDPAYNVDKQYNDQANIANADYKALKKATKDGTSYYYADKAFYPRENTFDVARQQYKNTTRVVFKVQYSTPDNSQLFAVRGQLQTFYLASDAQNLLKRSVLGSTRLHNLILKYKKSTIPTLAYTEANFNIEFGFADDENDLVDTEQGVLAGDFVITGLSFVDTFMEDNFKKDLTAEEKEDIASELAGVLKSANQANHIVPFTENTCYYAVYIKHFGDTYCPLPNGWVGDDVNEVYPNDNGNGLNSQRYLGRYGLVRNNWYDLTVNDIKRLGNATVPNGNVETSDDNKTEEWYLSARVHILSWAKRTQGVTFE